MTLREWFWKFDRWFPYGRRRRLSGHGELHKPDHETELAESNEPEAEEKAAMERERERRIEDKQRD